MEFADILYSPISNSVLPEDIKNFRQWADYYDSQEHHLFGGSLKQQRSKMLDIFLKGRSTNANTEAVGHDAYPWIIRHALIGKKFVDGFDTRFPDFLSWLETTFGVSKDKWGAITFITVKENFTNNKENNAWHQDGDFGLRFYVENEDDTCSVDPIRFVPTRKRYETQMRFNVDLHATGTYNLTPSNSLCQNNKELISQPLENTTAYYINNISACHSPVISQKKKRTAGFLILKEGYEDVTQKIMECAHKYKENVLLWTPETTSA